MNDNIQLISEMAIVDIDVNKHLNLIECQEKARKIDLFYEKFEAVIDMIDKAKKEFNNLLLGHIQKMKNKELKNEVRLIGKEYEKLRSKVFNFLLNFRKSQHSKEPHDQDSGIDQSQTSYTSKTISSDIFKNIVMDISSIKGNVDKFNGKGTKKRKKIITTERNNEESSTRSRNLQEKEKNNNIRSYMRLHNYNNTEERTTYQSNIVNTEKSGDLTVKGKQVYTERKILNGDEGNNARLSELEIERLSKEQVDVVKGLQTFMEKKLMVHEKINKIDDDFNQLVFKTTNNTEFKHMLSKKDSRESRAKSRNLRRIKKKVRSLSPNSFKLFQRQGLYQNPLLRKTNVSTETEIIHKQKAKFVSQERFKPSTINFENGSSSNYIEKTKRKRPGNVKVKKKKVDEKINQIVRTRRSTVEDKQSSYYYNYIQRKNQRSARTMMGTNTDRRIKSGLSSNSNRVLNAHGKLSLKRG